MTKFSSVAALLAVTTGGVPPRNDGEQRRARAGAVGVVYIRGLLESPFNREVTFPALAGVGTVRVVALLQDSGAGHVLGVSLQKL